MLMLRASPDIVFFAVIVAMMYLAFLVLLMAHKIMMFCTKIAFQLLSLGVLVLIVAASWQRGFEQNKEDFFAVVTDLLRHAAILKDVWIRRYQQYQDQESLG